MGKYYCNIYATSHVMWIVFFPGIKSKHIIYNDIIFFSNCNGNIVTFFLCIMDLFFLAELFAQFIFILFLQCIATWKKKEER